MPRDDWAKYARRDRARKAANSGDALHCDSRRSTRRRKPKRQRQRRGTCRACRNTRPLGREDICLACYKRLGAQVHAVAHKHSGPYPGTVLAAERVEAITGKQKPPRLESQRVGMTNNTLR